MSTDQLSKADIMFDRITDLANTRIGKIVVYGVATVACIFLAGNLLHILAAFVIGARTFSASFHSPV